MRLKATLLAVAIVILVTPQAEAENRDLESILKECGIGAAIFRSTPAAAAISNVIWDLGTTATLSELTDACPNVKNAKVALFIGSSYDKLETEIAMGDGKYLQTLSDLSGKSISEIRNNLSSVVANKNYATMNRLDKSDKLYSSVVK